MNKSRGIPIGEAARSLGVSVDTLRYYERIGLVPRPARTSGNARLYDEQDVSRLRFIRRAQKMDFSLEEIGMLLRMRADPANAREEVRTLTAHKLEIIDARLRELTQLRDELRLLLNLCGAAQAGCPILDELDGVDDIA
jgi:MerR family transcriptional regulator, copper efflux regulator